MEGMPPCFSVLSDEHGFFSQGKFDEVYDDAFVMLSQQGLYDSETVCLAPQVPDGQYVHVAGYVGDLHSQGPAHEMVQPRAYQPSLH